MCCISKIIKDRTSFQISEHFKTQIDGPFAYNNWANNFLFKTNDKIAYPVKFDIPRILWKSRQSIVEKVTTPKS